MSKWLQKLTAVAFGLSAAGVAAAPYCIEYSGVIDTVSEVVPNNPDQYATNPELPAAGEAFRLVLVLDNDGNKIYRLVSGALHSVPADEGVAVNFLMAQ